ncbi:MAG TPA: hypothetical protein VN370_03730, partial [Desulfitobacteriaceae bacterium]|nr:hypothetical protein [Desulfitobacteriaceae bacterium]
GKRMKEKYNKPEIESKPYAQFENVLACCNKNSGSCVGSLSSGGASYSSHQNQGITGFSGGSGRHGRPGHFGGFGHFGHH